MFPHPQPCAEDPVLSPAGVVADVPVLPAGLGGATTVELAPSRVEAPSASRRAASAVTLALDPEVTEPSAWTTPACASRLLPLKSVPETLRAVERAWVASRASAPRPSAISV